MSVMKTQWVVKKGVLEPFNDSTVEFMRSAHFRLGDVVSCEITMSRSPHFLRSMHKMARLLIEQTDTFHGKREHDVIKQLQSESKVGCDVYRGELKDNADVFLLYVPKSLSFDNMDEAEFRAIVDPLIDYVAETYWPNFDLSLLDDQT